jgi:hypothetical protein
MIETVASVLVALFFLQILGFIIHNLFMGPIWIVERIGWEIWMIIGFVGWVVYLYNFN